MNSTEPESGFHLLLRTVLNWRNAALMVTVATLSGAAVFGLSFLITPQYAATAVVVPAASAGPMSGLARLASNLGGLVGLGDLSMAGGESAVAKEMLQSRALLLTLIERHKLLPILFADQWDDSVGGWRPDLEGDVPSIQDAIDFMDRHVRRVVLDRDSGTIRVTMRWRDGGQAALWANDVVGLVNERARREAVQEAEQTVELLRLEAEKADKVEVRAAIFDVIGLQIRSIAVTRAQENLALKVIDPAMVPEPDAYDSPNRPLMAVTAALTAGFAVLFILLLWGRRERDVSRSAERRA